MTDQLTLGPLTVEYAPPIGADDNGGYRINARGVEQLAFVWQLNRYCLPDGGKGEQFGSDQAEHYARAFAASSEMLDALKDAEAEIACAQRHSTHVLEKVRAAISKATGLE